MDYFESNMAILRKTEPFFLTMTTPTIYSEALETSHLELLETYEEEISMRIKTEEGYVLLHSSYNIERENKYILADIEEGKDQLIIVFGLGLTHHLEALQDKLTPDSRVFIIEYRKDILDFVLTHLDMTRVLSDSRFNLISGEAKIIEQMIMVYFGANIYNIALNMKVINLPNYYQLYEDRIIGSLKSINRRILAQLHSYGNSLEDIFNGVINNYQNVDACIECNGLDELKDIYPDVPAIIVASGPSLDKNIHQLIKAKDQAVILACDASLKACEANGVLPDCVASIERDPEIYDYYYKDRSFDDQLVLIGPTVLWPDIFTSFKGKKVLSTRMNEGVDYWWSNQFERVDYMSTGQSSATYAYATAVRMGCNPIILIGQDLAYTEGKIHSDMTHHQEQGKNDDTRHDGIFLEDEEGNLLRSNTGYKLFKEWYELKILANDGVTTINATEGGVHIKGTKRMPLEEAIQTYCTKTKKTQLINRLKTHSFTQADYLKIYDQISQNVSIEIAKVERLKEMAQKHRLRLERLTKKYNMAKLSEKERNQVIIKMGKGDRIIHHILEEEETQSIRNYYRQIVTQTIGHVKKIGNTLTIENIQKNYQLQYNLMFIIENSSDLIIEKYKEMRRYIQEKQQERMAMNNERG